MRTVASLLTVLVLGAPLQAGQTSVIAPFVDDLTFVAVHVDVPRIDVDVLAKYLDEDAGHVAKAKALATLTKNTFVRSGGKDFYVLWSWASPLEEPVIVIPLAKEAASQTLAMLVGQIPGYQAEMKGN